MNLLNFYRSKKQSRDKRVRYRHTPKQSQAPTHATRKPRLKVMAVTKKHRLAIAESRRAEKKKRAPKNSAYQR